MLNILKQGCEEANLTRRADSSTASYKLPACHALHINHEHKPRPSAESSRAVTPEACTQLWSQVVCYAGDGAVCGEHLHGTDICRLTGSRIDR